jgi:DNA-binding MarR family transcriptional regulator
MDKLLVIKQLIERLEEYNQLSQSESVSLESFIVWLALQQNMVGNNQDSKEKVNHNSPSLDEAERLDIGIGGLNGLMYRYGRIYAKMALEQSETESIEEFNFLATLSAMEKATKTELINKMIFEKTTGTDIIRRLIKAGLINETKNPDDKRSFLLTVTEKGKFCLFKAFGKMAIVAKEVTGVLDLFEKKALYHVLLKLENHHRTNLPHIQQKLNQAFNQDKQ